MTMFIQLEDGNPVGHAVTEENFRLLFPNVSLSWPFVAEDIEPMGFGLWDFSSQPEIGIFEKVVEVDPAKDESSRWRQTWAVEPMNEEEIAARTEQEWGAVRAERNRKLMMCDWTQLADAPLTDEKRLEWVAYRQALRDITTQSDPFNITWPAKPAA